MVKKYYGHTSKFKWWVLPKKYNHTTKMTQALFFKECYPSGSINGIINPTNSMEGQI